jgi:hypothetical protein
MLLSKGFVKLRSLGVSPFVLALTVGLAGAASTGCFFVDGGGGHSDGPPPSDNGGAGGNTPGQNPGEISQVAIQPDQSLQAKPGDGVGIFVEYKSGGTWHVWTTCDTFTSKAVCNFDLFAGTAVATQLRSYATDTLEGPDEAKDLGNGTVELLAETDSDTDGLILETEPGAPLTLEPYLDGKSAEAFVYWVSDNVIHTGAPANPVEFVPSAK